MTDAIRTRQQLQAMFPTGVRGGIVAQSLRDFLASVPLTSELSSYSGYSGGGDSGYSGYSGYSGFPGGDSGYSGFSGGVVPAIHVVTSRGISESIDQTDELNAVYASCGNYDTILLVPGSDQSTFFVSSTLQWTGKDVNVIANGCTIECTGSGPNFPVVIYGAAVGTRNEGVLHWIGGTLIGGMIVQNVSSSWICPDKIDVGSLELRADTVCSYNTFDIQSISGGSVCLLINLVNTDANYVPPSGDTPGYHGEWANKNRFVHIQMDPAPGGVAIETNNLAPHWYPAQNYFDDCDFECGSEGCTMFNCIQFYGMFVNGYWEGNWSIGTLNTNPTQGQCTLVVNGEQGVPDFIKGDPRFLIIPANVNGWNGTFTTADSRTATVVDGIITNMS